MISFVLIKKNITFVPDSALDRAQKRQTLTKQNDYGYIYNYNQ